MNRIIAVLAGFLLLFGGTALGQKMPAHAFPGGGGKSSNANAQHFSAIGVGMAVGTASNGEHTAHHGFLSGARVFASRDIEAPVFDPPLQDLEFEVAAEVCLAEVVIPAITAVDNRDRNPTVEIQLLTEPPQDIDPAGEMVLLPPGSYDVLAVATDRKGNEREESFRIEVLDTTRPAVNPIPDPTPIGAEAEAQSPAGTRVAVNFGCVDVCDPNPQGSDVPEIYPVGDTAVELVCTDSAENSAAVTITVRVRDNSAPEIVGELPDAFNQLCNGQDGGTIDVPQVVWNDNGTVAAALTYGLVVDPGTEDEAAYAPIPDQLTLMVGVHTLRYTAEDVDGNVAQAEVQVEILDQTAPRIVVQDIPASGWFNAGEAAFTFTVSDDCGAADLLDVTVLPRPTNLSREGNTFTVDYAEDGMYTLQIEVTDLGDNTARDNSVAFGVDRTPPEVTIAVPSQRGVDANSTVTMPFFGRGEVLPVSFGAEEDADGVVSGIKSVRAILDPGEFNSRVLAEVTYEGNGTPRRGLRTVGNIDCSNNETYRNYPVCIDGDLNLRVIEAQQRVINIEIEDFAGNTTTLDAYFVNGDLGTAMQRVRDRLDAVLRPCATCPAAEGQELIDLQLARDRLDAGWHQADVTYQNSPFLTSTFLSGAIKSSQGALVNILLAIEATQDDGLRNTYIDQAELLARMASSDLTLYKLWIEDLDPAFALERFIRTSYATDMGLVTEYMTQTDEAIEAQDWTQAMASSLDASFHLKMAHELWIMDYHLSPQPLEEADGELDPNSINYREYQRARTILASIRDEINEYSINAHAGDEVATMRNIRDRLSVVLTQLDSLLEEGINAGLTDMAYLDMMLELRDIARSSAIAGNQGAYVRTYQYSMMQVVRWLAHFSLRTAEIFDPVDQPIYSYANQSMVEGVGLLDDRSIQQVIDLYGDVDKALCPLIGVYHCWFIRDETVLNVGIESDLPYPEEDIPEACWDLGMLPPSEWEDAAGDGDPVAPACRIDLEEE